MTVEERTNSLRKLSIITNFYIIRLKLDYAVMNAFSISADVTSKYYLLIGSLTSLEEIATKFRIDMYIDGCYYTSEMAHNLIYRMGIINTLFEQLPRRFFHRPIWQGEIH